MRGTWRFVSARMRAMTSRARLPSAPMLSSAKRASAMSGGSAASQRAPAAALATIAPRGWLTSWAIEVVSSPSVVSAVRMRELGLQSTQPLALLLGTLALRNVDRGAHQFHDFSGAIHHRMPDRVNMPDAAVGQHDPVLAGGVQLFADRFLQNPFPADPVLGVHSFEDGFPGQFFPVRIESENAVEFL